MNNGDDDKNLPTAANFLTTGRRRRLEARIVAYLTVFLLNAIVFAGWLLTRSNEIYDDLAKAISTLTLLNFAVICASVRHAVAANRKDNLGLIFHESGSYHLFLLVSTHIVIEFYRGIGNRYAIVTGIVFALLVPTIASICRRRRLQGLIHVVAFCLCALVSVLHSIYFLPLIAVVVPFVYGSRLTLRALVRPVIVTVERLSEDFALIELKIRKSRLTRFLLVDRLTEHNGDSTLWLVCHNLGLFERRSFDVIETRHRNRYVYARLVLAAKRQQDDWAEKLHDLLTTNQPYELFSCGVTITVDHCRVSSADPYSPSNLRRHRRLLFLLRNDEIVVLLRYLVFVCDPRNEKCRDRVRQISLHYCATTDLNYLLLLQEYLAIAATYKCVTVTTLIYTREQPILFNGSLTIVDDPHDERPMYENALRSLQNEHRLVIPDAAFRRRFERHVRRRLTRPEKTALRIL